MKILYVYSDKPAWKFPPEQVEWNCAEWRCAIFERAFNDSSNHKARMVYIGDWADGKADEDCVWADLIILQRNVFGSAMMKMLEWRIRGKPVAIDVDDAYHLMPRLVNAYSWWIEGKSFTKSGRPVIVKEKPYEQLIQSVKACDGLTTPSYILANDWLEWTDKVYHVPNYPDIKMYHFEEHIQSDTFYIGWGGSQSHLESWKKSNIIPALRTVAKENDDVRVLIVGDKRVYDLVNLKKHADFTPYVTHDKWHTILKQFDIGLVVLAQQYDRRRSWIKAVEYLLMGIPWVGTNYPIYGGLEKYGITVENTYREWHDGLTEVVQNYGKYKERAEEGKEYIIKHLDIRKNLDKVIESYQSIIDNFNEEYKNEHEIQS